MSATSLSPVELIDAARQLCQRRDADLDGRWPRASAILARQALEQALDNYWEQTRPEVAQVRAQHPKLLCLPSYLDPESARLAAQVWVTLSRACHHHAYELPPTAEELDSWFLDVERVLAALLQAVA